jgi:hypothetical protein
MANGHSDFLSLRDALRADRIRWLSLRDVHTTANATPSMMPIVLKRGSPSSARDYVDVDGLTQPNPSREVETETTLSDAKLVFGAPVFDDDDAVRRSIASLDLVHCVNSLASTRSCVNKVDTNVAVGNGDVIPACWTYIHRHVVS